MNLNNPTAWKSLKLPATKTVCLLLFAVFSVSCSIAPFKTPKTARPLGEGNWDIDVGASPAYYLTVNRGFSENLDVGLTLESQFGMNFELSGKYTFVNEGEEGYSLALFGGLYTGSIWGGSNSGLRLGPVLSYKSGWWEPYLVLTYNVGEWHWEAKTKETSEDSKDDDTFFNIDDFYPEQGKIASYFYAQFALGSNFWFTEGFAFNINFKYLVNTGGDVKIRGGTAGIGLYWRL